MKIQNLVIPLRSHLKLDLSALPQTNYNKGSLINQQAEATQNLKTTIHHDLRPNIVLCIAR